MVGKSEDLVFDGSRQISPPTKTIPSDNQPSQVSPDRTQRSPSVDTAEPSPDPKCILIGWELGAGMGHVGMLRPLAEALRRQGHRVVLALRETKQAQTLLDGTGLEVVSAPLWTPPQNGPQVDLHTLGDVLHAFGFSDRERLHRQAVAWSELIHTFDPRLVIGEYSPGLALAALGVRRYITVGSGFTVLPPVPSAPPFRHWEQLPPPSSAACERAVMEAANWARRELGLPRLSYLADLFGGDFVGVCTYPALDNYRAYRKTRALGPIMGSPRKERDSCVRDGVFAYLSGLTSDFDAVVSGLARAGIAVSAHVRDLQPGQEDILRACRIQLHRSPRDLFDELPTRKAIVHHGGLSTTHVAIGTATPQLVLPNSTEQLITAQRLVDLRLGLGLSRPQRTQSVIAGALGEVISRGIFESRALALRQEAQRHTGPSALCILVRECNALLGT